MKNISLITLLFISLTTNIFSQSTANWRDKVAPEILAAFNRGESSDLLVAFHEQADLKGAKMIHGKSAKARFVFNRLQETAQRTQARAIQIIRNNHAGANTLFLVNALLVPHADAALAQQLAALPEVRFICYDPWIFFSSPTETTVDAATERNGIEWGVQHVNAPQVWSMGYTGQGITIGGADTGYDWAHPGLKSKYRGWNDAGSSADHNYNWHDAIHEFNPLNNDTLGNPGVNNCGFDVNQPCDDGKHGTHTMGTMVGDDGLGNQTGVAPGAKWVGCRNMERGWGKPSTYLECFQWFLAPTDLGGQNPDPDKAPHVISNSWVCVSQEGCTDVTVNDILRIAVVNLRASGVMVVVAAGNNGKDGCSSVYEAPAYFEESFSIGAIRNDDSIAAFSSRGPVLSDGSYRIKPNISAPGFDVRSTIPNGGYEKLSGTSMATPHIAGVVALILSARPDLAGEVDLLENFLEETAIPLRDTLICGNVAGTSIPNNTFGFGKVDALGALQAALAYQPATGVSSPAIHASVAPNPVVGTVIFDVENLFGKTTLEIFSIDGKAVYSKKWSASSREILQISLENQPAGLYFWQISSETGTTTGKLVKS